MDPVAVAEKIMQKPSEGKQKAEHIIEDAGVNPKFLEAVIHNVVEKSSDSQLLGLSLDPELAMSVGVVTLAMILKLHADETANALRQA